MSTNDQFATQIPGVTPIENTPPAQEGVHYTLKRPITDPATGIMITSVRIDKLTAGAVEAHGIPLDAATGSINMPVAMKLLEASSGIQLPVLRTLHASDAVNAALKLVTELMGESDESVGNASTT